MTAPSNAPGEIRTCWLSWIAVETTDQASLVKHLDLTGIRRIAWSEGTELVDADAHGGADHRSVVVTPAVRGWTLAFGFWCSLLKLENVAPVTDLCRGLSARFGSAQAYFSSEQNDGDAWLITRNGTVIRRFISEYPELALGEPFGAERRHLDAAGIPGRPEDLDPASDAAADWLAGTYLFAAAEIAAESSLDPTSITEDVPVVGSMLVGQAPQRSTLPPTP